MKKYFIITYGCQMNKSDSERIATFLERINLKPTKKMSEANLILVNMCSVRQSAVDRVHGLAPKLKKLKSKNPKLKTIITGCVLKKDRVKFAKEFDSVLDIKDLSGWPKLFRTMRARQETKKYFEIPPKYQTRFSAFIPIMTGCNNFCAYCVVPYTRGREISRQTKEILREIENLVRKGYKEIWLLGQNVNSYHSRIYTNTSTNITNNYSRKFVPKFVKIRDVNFAKLLKMVNDIPGNFWIRFTSSHPKPSTRAKLGAGLVPHRNEVSGAGDFSWDELTEVMAKCQKVTPYLNLPVQSGDDEILKKMNRLYTIKHYKKLIKKIRTAFSKYRKGLEKDISISTDIIVGFPGETKKQFENTVKLLKEIKYDMAYIAKYSPRPGTVAAKLKDNVSPKEKERRYKILTEILKKTALKNNKKYLGKEVEVLVETRKNQFLIGKSRHYKTVKFESNQDLIGQFVKVKIIDALPWGLKGEML